MGGAVISEDGRYRYRLERRWSKVPGTALFVMLNPSTADAEKDDPTIRRCVGFAKGWGLGHLIVTNVFALRATDPEELALERDPVGPENEGHLRKAAQEADVIVVAWGAGPRRLFAVRYLRLASVISDLAGPSTISQPLGRPLWCLGTTKNGSPRHPLYLPKDTGLKLWRRK